MKALKIFFTEVLFCGLLACNNKTETINTNSAGNPAPADMNIATTEKPTLNNPILMNGSSFGNYFQALYKLGRFDDLLLFTSSQTIDEHGREKVLNAFRKMDFGYKLELKSKQDNSDGSITLNYISHQFATPKIVRMIVTIENDSVKLVNGDFVSFL